MTRRRVGAVAATLAAIVVFTVWRWVLAPDTVEPDEVAGADAVVMFVGGQGERLVAAERLMEGGAADVLVIPNGWSRRWPDANLLCVGNAPYEVVCERPDPDTTRGEARLIATIAADRGWESVVAVTSDYHAGRASLLLDRCFDGSVVTVAAPSETTAGGWLRRVGHEWLGQLYARVVERGC